MKGVGEMASMITIRLEKPTGTTFVYALKHELDPQGLLRSFDPSYWERLLSESPAKPDHPHDVMRLVQLYFTLSENILAYLGGVLCYGPRALLPWLVVYTPGDLREMAEMFRRGYLELRGEATEVEAPVRDLYNADEQTTNHIMRILRAAGSSWKHRYLNDAIKHGLRATSAPLHVAFAPSGKEHQMHGLIAEPVAVHASCATRTPSGSKQRLPSKHRLLGTNSRGFHPEETRSHCEWMVAILTNLKTVLSNAAGKAKGRLSWPQSAPPKYFRSFVQGTQGFTPNLTPEDCRAIERQAERRTSTSRDEPLRTEEG